MDKYLIALTSVARRQVPPMDLSKEIPLKFNVIIFERGFRGRSITVEMDDCLVAPILATFPVTIKIQKRRVFR